MLKKSNKFFKKSNKSMIFGKKSFDLNIKKSVDLNQLDLNQLNPACIETNILRP